MCLLLLSFVSNLERQEIVGSKGNSFLLTHLLIFLIFSFKTTKRERWSEHFSFLSPFHWSKHSRRIIFNGLVRNCCGCWQIWKRVNLALNSNLCNLDIPTNYKSHNELLKKSLDWRAGFGLLLWQSSKHA